MRSRSRVAGACLTLCLFVPLPFLAQSPARDRTWFATVYAGQWFLESAPDPGQTLGTQAEINRTRGDQHPYPGRQAPR
jgi:hypothetical protein